MQCRRAGFNPWVGKIPWRREWEPTSIFLPGEFHGHRSLVGLQLMGLQTVGHDWATTTHFSSVQFSSVAQLCPTICNPMNRSTPGLPVHHQLPEFAQTIKSVMPSSHLILCHPLLYTHIETQTHTHTHTHTHIYMYTHYYIYIYLFIYLFIQDEMILQTYYSGN